MKISVRNNNIQLETSRLLILLFLLLCIPLSSYASPLIYTIQTGSFHHIDDAQKQFDSIVNKLDEKQLDNLRIEKIGKFYSVRLGKYDQRNEAETTLSAIKERLRSHLIMNAYYKEERIRKLYNHAKIDADESQAKSGPQEKSRSVNIQPPVVEKVVDKETDMNFREKELNATSGVVAKKSDENDLEALKAKLALRPEDPDMNGRYGTALFRLKKPAEAIPYLKKATELSPGVPQYHISIGYCLLLLSNFDEAVDEFNRALTISPSHVGALTGLGISYSELGEKDKAMHVYDKLKNLDAVLTEILLQIIEES